MNRIFLMALLASASLSCRNAASNADTESTRLSDGVEGSKIAIPPPCTTPTGSSVYLRLVPGNAIGLTEYFPDGFWPGIAAGKKVRSLVLLLVGGNPNGPGGCILDMMTARSGYPQGAGGTTQALRAWRDSVQGSHEPIPEAVYSLGQSALLHGKGPYLEWLSTQSEFARDNATGRRFVKPEFASAMRVPAPTTAWPAGFMPLGSLESRYSGNLAGLGPAVVRISPTSGFPQTGSSRDGMYLHFDVNEEEAPGTSGCLGVQRIKVNRLMCWMRYFKPTTLVADYGKGTVSSNDKPYLVDRQYIRYTPESAEAFQSSLAGFPCAQNSEQIFNGYDAFDPSKAGQGK